MPLRPILFDPVVLVPVCLGLDLLLGDPPYRWHPIRLMGALLSRWETLLRRLGWDGRGGGFLLFLALGASVFAPVLALLFFLGRLHWLAAWMLTVYLGYSLIAIKDLCLHGERVVAAVEAGDAERARRAAADLVGRDVDGMDAAACNRAAVESLAENLADGVIAPLLYFLILGLPGLLLFKIASTMDSMVGHRTPRYLRFGWFGARLDDALCYLPSRLTFLLIVAWSALARGLSARKAWRIGLAQHALVPGPNAGWSEAAAAGALGVRLAGPIHLGGRKVSDVWLGHSEDPEGAGPVDVRRMQRIAYGATALFLLLGVGLRLALKPA